MQLSESTHTPTIDLGKLCMASEGIRAALVMGLDGEVYQTFGEDEAGLKKAVSLGIGVLDLGQRLSTEVGIGMLRAHLFSAESGTLVVHHVDDETIVVLVADNSVQFGALLYDIQYVVKNASANDGGRQWT